MPGHIVTSYDTDLENLRRSISEMGGVAEKMTAEATDALVRRDDTLAQAVILADKRLDALQRDIEERAVLLIARRQPLAIDLRETISAIRVSGDLERIGDLAKNVAKRVVAISDQAPAQKIVLGVRHMSDLAEGQLKDVLDAYASRDVAHQLDQDVSTDDRRRIRPGPRDGSRDREARPNRVAESAPGRIARDVGRQFDGLNGLLRVAPAASEAHTHPRSPGVAMEDGARGSAERRHRRGEGRSPQVRRHEKPRGQHTCRRTGPCRNFVLRTLGDAQRTFSGHRRLHALGLGSLDQ